MTDYQEIIDGYIKTLLFFLPISLVTLAVAYRNGFFTWTESKSKIPGVDLLGAFVFFIGSHLFIQTAYFYTFKMKDPQWAGILSMLASALVILMYTRTIASSSRRLLWNTKKQDRMPNFLFGASVLLIAYPLVVLIGQAIRIVMLAVFQIAEIDQIAVKSLKSTFDDPQLFAAMIICVIIAVPIVEETLFRGYLQNWMKRWMGSKLSIVITSAIFACCHYSSYQGFSNIELLVSLFVLSLFLGIAYEKKQSLWAPIGMHMIFNLINVLMLSVANI